MKVGELQNRLSVRLKCNFGWPMRKVDSHDTTDTTDTADTNSDESRDPPSIEKDLNEIDLGAKLTRDLFSIRLERLLV